MPRRTFRPRLEALEPRLLLNAAPVFNDQTLRVDENRPAGTLVGAMQADHDGPLTFEVTGGTSQNVFSLNASSGEVEVRLPDSLDHETTFLFQLDVVARDAGNPALATEAVVTILVNDINEQPVLKAALAKEQALGSLKYQFTIPSDTFRDPDVGDSLSYALTRDDGSALPDWLTFNPSTLQLAGFPPNLPGTTPLRLVATDAAGLSAEALFLFEVIENPFPWQNLLNPLDANADEQITPQDVVLLTSSLLTKGVHALPAAGPANPPAYLDVYSDNQLTPQDIVHLVAHFLRSGEGEGESGGRPSGWAIRPAGDSAELEAAFSLASDDRSWFEEWVAERSVRDLVASSAGTDW